jgi:HlyD family secretion protein
MANTGKRGWLKWVAGLSVAGLGLLAWWYFRNHQPAKIEFQTAKIQRGELTQVVTATGTLNPVTNVTVGSQISGNILKLYADFNSPVTNGQIIAQLDPATYQANVKTAAADLANSKAALELAQVNARRADELVKNRLISQSDYDTTLAALHQAEAQVLSKSAAVDRANVDLARCTIYAPVDGLVISRNVDVGQTVAASLSAPTLFVIANDLAQMQIDANVAEADIGGVVMGQDVDFSVDAFPTRTFHGKVVQVRNSPITLQNVVTYDTVISVNNSDLKLKPGMTANVSIIIARRDDALKIPNAALRFRPPEAAQVDANTNAVAQKTGPAPNRGGDSPGASGGPGRGGGRRSSGDRPPVRTVYLLNATTPANPGQPVLKAVQVKTGIGDGLFTEVVDGLAEGDLVVISATTSGGAASQPQSNPFGGPGFRRF